MGLEIRGEGGGGESLFVRTWGVGGLHRSRHTGYFC